MDAKRDVTANDSLRRSAWFAARARNAMRRVHLTTVAGGIAVVATFAAIIAASEEANRRTEQQLAAIPANQDRAEYAKVLSELRQKYQRAEDALREAKRADSALTAILASSATANSSEGSQGQRTTTTVAQSGEAAIADLQQRLNRARNAPLTDNYVELFNSVLIRDNVRASALVDSINMVDREREAFAALGGIDARYAALSARHAELGRQLVSIADARIASFTSSNQGDSTNSGDISRGVRRDLESIEQLEKSAAAAGLEVKKAEEKFAQVEEYNSSLDEQRNSIRRRSDLNIPLYASLLSAIVIGAFASYGTALVLELRKPRIADSYEAERIADSRVIVHSAAATKVGASRTRRRADRELPSVLDNTSDSYQLAHLSLTGLGDVARRVAVIGESSSLTATVAINLASAAAREARAVLLVDLDLKNRLLGELLHIKDRAGMSDVLMGSAELLGGLKEFPAGRDVYMTVLHGGERQPRAVGQERLTVVKEDLSRLAARYDLTVIIAGEVHLFNSILPSDDIILVAKATQTPTKWLSTAVSRIRSSGQRVRAVLLWKA